MEKNAPIFVAGIDTLIGAALSRKLVSQGHGNLCVPTAGLDLTRREQVDDFFARHRPEFVFLAAGKSGGIAANQKYPAELMIDNLLVSVHVIDASHRHGVRKLLYLASSCCYPRLCPQPMQVAHLGTGKLEPTNEAYATAKLAGLQMCLAYRRQFGARFIAAIPANAYGLGDCFNLEDAHVIGALLRRMHEAKLQNAESVLIWGSGTPRREFVFADDLADACILLMNRYDSDDVINLGSGQSHSIRELAEEIREVVGFAGRLQFDESRPDGMPDKSLDGGPLRQLGWRPSTSLRDGLRATYDWFVDNERMGTVGHV